MKVAQIKSAPQFESRDWRQYGIQTYGDTNDFPQTVSEIVQASKTGNACLSIYNDFVYGHGFKDPGIYKLRVNKEGEKLDKILRMVCKDFTLWHGFAIHVNYNMNFRVSSIHHIPFESLRAGHTGTRCRTAHVHSAGTPPPPLHRLPRRLLDADRPGTCCRYQRDR